MCDHDLAASNFVQATSLPGFLKKALSREKTPEYEAP